MLIISQAPANSWQVETVRVFADSITYKRDMLLCNFVDGHTFEELMNNHPIEPPDEQLAKLFEQLSTYILGGVRTLGVMKRVAYGLYYIVYWDWTFQLRLSLGKYVRKVIIFSAALEILGACFHWVKSLYLYELEHQTIGLHRAQQKLITWIDLSGTAPFFTWVSSRFNEIVRITTILEPYLMLVLLSCALVLWWHHHRLSMRVERHQELLGLLATALDQAAKLDFFAAGNILNEDMARQYTECVLDRLLLTLEKSNRYKPSIGASVWVQSAPGSEFDLWLQIKREYSIRKLGDNQESLVGLCASDPTTAIFYLPKASLNHAVKIGLEQEGTITYRTTRPVWDAFNPGKQTEGELEMVRSSICVRIPIEGPGIGRRGFQGEACLCIDSNVTDCFGELDYFAAQAWAGLLGSVFARLRHSN